MTTTDKGGLPAPVRAALNVELALFYSGAKSSLPHRLWARVLEYLDYAELCVAARTSILLCYAAWDPSVGAYASGALWVPSLQKQDGDNMPVTSLAIGRAKAAIPMAGRVELAKRRRLEKNDALLVKDNDHECIITLPSGALVDEKDVIDQAAEPIYCYSSASVRNSCTDLLRVNHSKGDDDGVRITAMSLRAIPRLLLVGTATGEVVSLGLKNREWVNYGYWRGLHQGAVRSIQVHWNMAVTGGDDGVIRLFEVPSSGPEWDSLVVATTTSSSPEEETTMTPSTRMRELRIGERSCCLTVARNKAVSNVALSSSRVFFTWGWKKGPTVSFYDIHDPLVASHFSAIDASTKKVLYSVEAHKGPATALEVCDGVDGSPVAWTGGTDGVVCAWDLRCRTGAAISASTSVGPRWTCAVLSLSRGSARNPWRIFASTDDGYIHAFDTRRVTKPQFSVEAQITDKRKFKRHIRFSACGSNGPLLVGASYCGGPPTKPLCAQLDFWNACDFSTPKHVATIPLHNSCPDSLQWHGRLMALALLTPPRLATGSVQLFDISCTNAPPVTLT